MPQKVPAGGRTHRVEKSKARADRSAKMRDCNIAEEAARKVAQDVATPLQPPLQPPLQDNAAEQEDKAALAKDNKYAKCGNILEVAVAKELGLD